MVRVVRSAFTVFIAALVFFVLGCARTGGLGEQSDVPPLIVSQGSIISWGPDISWLEHPTPEFVQVVEISKTTEAKRSFGLMLTEGPNLETKIYGLIGLKLIGFERWELASKLPRNRGNYHTQIDVDAYPLYYLGLDSSSVTRASFSDIVEDLEKWDGDVFFKDWDDEILKSVRSR